MPNIYCVGVDVGTGSARAALVNGHGDIIQTHIESIKTWNPQTDYYEQSSDNIWKAVCKCVQNVTEKYDKNEIVSIGFDATCSLVVFDKEYKPLSISKTGNNEQNIILWMDHRANEEADFINGTNHELLRYVGDKISLEMQCPKLLWLKKNLPISCWSKIGRIMDLPDFLTWKSTGMATNSLCSVVCKWSYDAEQNSWSKDFLRKINLVDLCANDFEKLGKTIYSPGTAIGNGLTDLAASELSLLPNTPVGASMIDAHAGALSLFGCKGDGIDTDVMSKMALICGTSSCHMSVTNELIFASGIWGPYKNALYPNMYLHEAGQSATGILLEHIIKIHPAYEIVVGNAKNKHIHEYLNELLKKISEKNKITNVQELTNNIHVWPDYHGNRSPIADSNLKGMMSGLTMACDEENLAIMYLAFVQALAYGTRHILDSLKSSNRKEFSSLSICGGLSKNSIFVQTHADVCQMPVLFPTSTEMVLTGAAILGAFAAKLYPDLESASKAMSGKGTVIQPNYNCIEYHNRKYKVFRKMLDDQRSYEKIMMDS